MAFADYEQERQRLAASCRLVDSLWARTVGGTTSIEKAVGEDVALGGTVVSELLREATRRLESSSVEIGVFGSIKRGKSTLINALVGADVSPMRVTPETAVPVWIESGPIATTVLLADGTVVEDLQVEEARTMSTQRYKAKKSGKKPIRVMHRRPIDWLPEGVRVIDTPGLDDPSLADDYESLTLAELDRVAAAIVVLSSPPGPAGDEVRLLQSLGQRGVDKLFLVCNMYPEQWESSETRQLMSEYIESIVVDSAPGVDPEDVKVFTVSARDAFRAAESGDHEAFQASGVDSLRRKLEAHLTHGILDRMLVFVQRRLEMAVNLTREVLYKRRELILNPEGLVAAKAELASAVKTSQRSLVQVRDEIRQFMDETESEMQTLLAAPFETALESVASASRIPDLEALSSRLRIQFEAASTEASNLFARRSELAEMRMMRQMFDLFGDAVSSSSTARSSAIRLQADVAPILPSPKIDWGVVGGAGVIGGAAAGIGTATLAGGVGTAFLMAGPVGWLIGLGVGALIGGGMLGATAGLATRKTVSEQQRSEVASQIVSAQRQVVRSTADAVSRWVETLLLGMASQHKGFFDSRDSELARLDAILNDQPRRERELADVQSLLAELEHAGF